MNEAGPERSENIGLFQMVVLVLSIVILAALGLGTILKLPGPASELLNFFDTIVCFLLLVDFGIRFRQAPSKLVFMKWGWIDLIASIPYVPALRYGRLVRILRVIRLLRAIRATHKINALVMNNKIRTGATSVPLVAFLLIMFSSIGELICEQGNPNANILTAEDAIWWSVTTITTVGYGDKYPVTIEGRIVAMILMVSGIGLFGALSGLAASYFLHSKEKDEAPEQDEILSRLKQIEEKIDRLKREE
jgi:voltage-gated potassium channel